MSDPLTTVRTYTPVQVLRMVARDIRRMRVLMAEGRFIEVHARLGVMSDHLDMRLGERDEYGLYPEEEVFDGSESAGEGYAG